MSNELPISSPYRSTPDAPVTETERDQLSSRLNAAYTAGTLDADDYRTRLDTLFAAQRMGELVPVALEARIQSFMESEEQRRQIELDALKKQKEV